MKKKKIFYAFFLFCLFLSKVGSFHGFTHDDSLDNKVEHCDFCHMATKNDIGDFLLLQNNFEFIPIVYSDILTKIEYPSHKNSIDISIKLYSRPPPSINL